MVMSLYFKEGVINGKRGEAEYVRQLPKLQAGER
jgi:hypothetical protein